MPSDKDVILARIELDRFRLRRARQAMAGVATQLPGAGQAMYAKLATTIDETDTGLADLADRTRKYDVSTDRLAALTERRQATDRVVDEAFALATGTLARRDGLDDGACAEADRLIAELAATVDPGLARPTVPGESEFLHRAAFVIRRRVPDHGVWDLPVMAHEFGHVLTTRFDLYDPITNTVRPLGAEALGGWPGCTGPQAEELFCDVFATFATGPAYPCTMLLHRLDPTADATIDPRRSHPPDPVRAAVLLEALNRLTAGEPPEGRYRMVHEQLTLAWAALGEHAPASAAVSAEQQATIRRQVTTTLALLGKKVRPLRYAWRNAVLRQLAQALDGNRKPDGGIGFQIRDVLTVAWLARLDATAAHPAPEHLDDWVRSLI
ncbi:hypothetical protein GCM10010168_70620 [Actinoplanes ianthinogenes]|uniref:Uncharacterized protein n=1 Tax=Actinoplanes ianthinogenes TaxID=122358 RepID=A0ABN6CQ49_9ACTN|nr:hypothetical protein [Actinoplanes ianthinogenes]BCJ47348.1 hypothetical protein Aiant_80050 [Actinoplanes ianthinogenes]GGR41871.1 hypothetical protein GCM10010168_70620 [Actinoplanes ianthinogenes]